MTNWAVIGISGKARSGKSEMHKLIKNLSPNDYKVINSPLAEKLKEIATSLFKWDGDKVLYEKEDGSIDETRGRGLLIGIGRRMRDINPNVWVNFVIDRIVSDIRELDLYRSDQMNNVLFVIDDVRYQNELSRLRIFGNKFVSVRLSRKSELNIETESETELDGHLDFKFMINNNGDLNDLQFEVSEVLKSAIEASKGRIYA